MAKKGFSPAVSNQMLSITTAISLSGFKGMGVYRPGLLVGRVIIRDLFLCTDFQI
jgi:hypothetical protein